MAEKYIMIHDIMSEHKDRMLNLKKYYPFFVLCETTFSQYKEGKFMDLDMGYITMATLRYFINENNFHESEITYEQYEKFLAEILRREFRLELSEEEEQELIGYIFDKIKNDGRAFTFSYFDPEEKKKKTARVKLIDSRIVDGVVLYHVTTDGIEFYLDTKEIKDESNISVQQLLLEKMIQSENFAGGIEVIKRINNEVNKLALQKKEVLDLLSYDVFSGAKASEEYMETVARWFDEESKLFEKNRALIDKAFAKANNANKEILASQGDDADGAGKQTVKGMSASSAILSEIHKLDTELKKTIIKHGELIKETIELQNIADEMIARAKLRKLRPVFNFRDAMKKTMQHNRVDQLGMLVSPLFMPKLTKSFAPESIDRMLESKMDNADYGEKVEKKQVDTDYVFEDEIEDNRISANFARLFGELLEQLWKHGKTTLPELMAIYEIKFGKEIYRNGDVYSFLVHLAQKNQYSLKKMQDKQDTFLEGLVMDHMSLEKKDQFANMVFDIHFDVANILKFGEGKDEAFTITDMHFSVAE
ncbi:MAG: hypothetical protein E7264_05870 [Lachnospiraceae bacterium]|nr:hypothetical protein [Lachnospiraceae bacterium]